MKVYLAGYQGSTPEREERLIRAGVDKNRCFSFANLSPIPGLPFMVKGICDGYETCLKFKQTGIMMDSGVFSYRTHRARLIKNGADLGQLPTPEGYMKLYVKWCKKFSKHWDFYVTVDMRPNCAENLELHNKLESMGIRPMPVYHGDDNIDYLARYAAKGYDYICLGSTPSVRTGVQQFRRYYDHVFNWGEKNRVRFHGLAVTKPWSMIGYPWRSVDSSSWSRAAGYGNILRFDENTQRLTTLHVSDRVSSAARLHLNKDLRSRIKKDLEAEGYDFEELHTDHTARHIYNAATMLKLAAFAEAIHKGHRRLLV